MSPSTLRGYTAKDLAQMARREGVAGWHGMRKAELISVLASLKENSGNGKPRDQSGETSPRPRAAKPPTAAQRRLNAAQQERRRLQDLSTPQHNGSADRVIVMVRDPYWLHVSWEIAAGSVRRAQTALGQNWHTAKPMLRIVRLGEGSEVLSHRHLPVHGGVNHWYVDVDTPPSRYRVEIGYGGRSSNGRDAEFYCLARSNEVTTPAPGLAESVDPNWNDVARNADRVYAMSGGYSPGGPSLELREALESRLRRPMGRPSETRFLDQRPATEAEEAALQVEIDAEVVVFGHAAPNAHLTIHGEPVEVDEAGAFAVKLPLPDRRQVIPVVVGTGDGRCQRTIVMGVERNTKLLEPRRRESAAS